MADELIATARRRLFTAVLSDVLDAAGRRSQAMHPGVRPLDDALVMVGRAAPGSYRTSITSRPARILTSSRSGWWTT